MCTLRIGDGEPDRVRDKDLADNVNKDLSIQSKRLEIRPGCDNLVALEFHPKLHVPSKEHSIYSPRLELKEPLSVGLGWPELNAHTEGNNLTSERRHPVLSLIGGEPVCALPPNAAGDASVAPRERPPFVRKPRLTQVAARRFLGAAHFYL